jgi:hypothetical protein
LNDRAAEVGYARGMADTYEAPRIEARTDIGQTLIGELASGNIDVPESAAFRSV